jgi:hypothetical protein
LEGQANNRRRRREKKTGKASLCPGWDSNPAPDWHKSTFPCQIPNVV